MAIDETSVIDFVSVHDANNVNLTISDHLDWAEMEKHLMLLQEKINTHCKYVENGQLKPNGFSKRQDRRWSNRDSRSPGLFTVQTKRPSDRWEPVDEAARQRMRHPCV